MTNGLAQLLTATKVPKRVVLVARWQIDERDPEHFISGFGRARPSTDSAERGYEQLLAERRAKGRDPLMLLRTSDSSPAHTQAAMLARLSRIGSGRVEIVSEAHVEGGIEVGRRGVTVTVREESGGLRRYRAPMM